MASEVGTLPIDVGRVVRKGRLQPGRMFLIDTAQGRIIDDAEIKAELAAAHPYGEWMADKLRRLEDLPEVAHIRESRRDVLREQQTFGYTQEDLKILIEPMVRTGAEPIGSMGTDTPLAVLSERPRLVYDYFQQLFAQVTNPPLDAIRESWSPRSARSSAPESNLLDPGPESCHLLEMPHRSSPTRTWTGSNTSRRPTRTSRPAPCAACSRVLRRPGSGWALERIRSEVSEAIAEGANVIILSDWLSNEDLALIPMLLATSAVHHHLIREKTRTQVGLVVETGEAREVHHFALLLGFGAAAVNPYLAFDSIEHMVAEGTTTVTDFDAAVANYRKAVGKGILKVMSKMGISTVASYTGAQIFEAIGLGAELVDEYFTGTVSRLGGIGLDEVAEEVRRRHAPPTRSARRSAHRTLESGGEYQWRREGEYHLFNPETVYKLQHSTRSGQYEVFKEYTQLVNDQAENLATLRGLFALRTGVRPCSSTRSNRVRDRQAVLDRCDELRLDLRRGPRDARHAMNRLGGKSNTGEGGEDPDRFTPDDNAATCAARRSSRWPRVASASPPST